MLSPRYNVVRPLQAGLEWLARLELAIVALMLIAALFISAYAIVARNAGYSTGDWALALPEVLLVWMTFLGCGSLVTRDEHVTANFLLHLFPSAFQRVVSIALMLIAIAALLPVFWGSWQIVSEMWSLGIRDSEVLDAPKAIIQAAVPVGMGLCLIHLTGRCLEILVAERTELRP